MGGKPFAEGTKDVCLVSMAWSALLRHICSSTAPQFSCASTLWSEPPPSGRIISKSHMVWGCCSIKTLFCPLHSWGWARSLSAPFVSIIQNTEWAPRLMTIHVSWDNRRWHWGLSLLYPDLDQSSPKKETLHNCVTQQLGYALCLPRVLDDWKDGIWQGCLWDSKGTSWITGGKGGISILTGVTSQSYDPRQRPRMCQESHALGMQVEVTWFLGKGWAISSHTRFQENSPNPCTCWAVWWVCPWAPWYFWDALGLCLMDSPWLAYISQRKYIKGVIEHDRSLGSVADKLSRE